MSQRFLVDANLPRSAWAVLKKHGHRAEHVRDIGLADAPDPLIAERAKAMEAILVTRDLDFADIRAHPPQDCPGILVLRVPEYDRANEIADVLESLLLKPDLVKSLPRRLTILERGHVRFWPKID